MFFDFYVTLWGTISPNKLIIVKIRLEKVDLGEVCIQKEQENFKKRSSSNTIGRPLHMSHPVTQGVKHLKVNLNQKRVTFVTSLFFLPRIYRS